MYYLNFLIFHLINFMPSFIYIDEKKNSGKTIINDARNNSRDMDGKLINNKEGLIGFKSGRGLLI